MTIVLASEMPVWRSAIPRTRKKPVRVVRRVSGHAARTQASLVRNSPPDTRTARRGPADTLAASAPSARRTLTRSTGAAGALRGVT